MRIDVRKLLQLPMPTLALGALNAALVIGVLVLAFGGTRAGELLATPAKPPAPLTIELANAPPQADLAAIQAQPLMHATRAFYAPPPPDAVPVAPPLPAYRLAGSFISPNKPAVALLADSQNGMTRRVRSGDDLNGWRVLSIDGKRVVLSWQDQTREIGVPAAQTTSGLRRVPIQRSRVASSTGSTISLGAGGGGASAVGGAPMSPGNQYPSAPIDRPRVYRPPPN